MNEIVDNKNSFCFQFLDYDNEIVNYCVNEEVPHCKLLTNTNKLSLLARKMNVNDICNYYGVDIKLFFKGDMINRTVSKYSELFANKVVFEKYFENNIICDNSLDILYKKKKKLIIKLSKYNELGFVHETSILNLRSIYESGYIYCRNEVEKRMILAMDIAEHSVLDRTKNYFSEMARFYLRTRTPASYRFHNNGISTCILVCDYNLIFHEKDIYLTNKMATKNINLCNLNDEYDLDWLYFNLNYDKIYEKKYVDCRDYKGAEFLIKNKMPIKYIKAIIFRNISECKQFIEDFPNWNIDVICDKNQFGIKEC